MPLRNVSQNPRCFWPNSSHPLPAVQRAMELAKKRGVTTVLNPAPAQPLPEDVLRYADYLMPNETETSLLTGLPVETPEQFAAAARRLREMGVGTVDPDVGLDGRLSVHGRRRRALPGLSHPAGRHHCRG